MNIAKEKIPAHALLCNAGRNGENAEFFKAIFMLGVSIEIQLFTGRNIS